MPRHPLKREIIATHVTNSMINRVGSTFVHRLLETTGAKPPEIVRAYLLNREIFGFVDLWLAIEALDNKVDDAVQSAMLIDTSRLIDARHDVVPALAPAERGHGGDHRAFHAEGRGAGGAAAAAAGRRRACAHRRRGRALRRQGVPRELADARRQLRHAVRDAGHHRGRRTRRSARRKSSPSSTSSSPTSSDCRGCASGSPRCRATRTGRCWPRTRCRTTFPACSATITADVLAGSPEVTHSASALIAAWQDRNRRGIERAAQLLAELRAAGAVDAAMLSVALRELRGLPAEFGAARRARRGAARALARATDSP